jgi:hypothetical protein
MKDLVVDHLLGEILMLRNAHFVLKDYFVLDIAAVIIAVGFS